MEIGITHAAEALKTPTLKDAAKALKTTDLTEALKSDSSVFTGALKGEKSSSIIGNKFAPSSDTRPTKPKTEKGILEALKKQDKEQGLVCYEGGNDITKLNARRKQVIILMEQGYTYDEALAKTRTNKGLSIMPIEEDLDPFFKEESKNSIIDFDLRKY